uniref:Abnormal cell migration protein 18-like fibronectin type I domain-containing protein n=1 Tax=Ascaris lumbricoides TaxID=6252 RepID=A0A0M3I7W7_ASCLU
MGCRNIVSSDFFVHKVFIRHEINAFRLLNYWEKSFYFSLEMKHSILILLLLVPLFEAVPNSRHKREEKSSTKTLALPATISEVLTFNAASSSSQLFSMPTNCSHAGKIYKQGEHWYAGHLRYRCGKFGVYEILGCRTDKEKILEIGETYIDDNVAHQCFQKSSAIYYRQSVCGILGQPDCDKLTTLAAAGLPEGWKIVDAKGNPIPLSSIRVISRTLPVVSQRSVTATQKQQRRKRQTSAGVGSAIPVDVTLSEEKRRNKDERIVGIGTGSVSLDSRRPTITIGDQKYKPGTVAGTRSEVTWSGKDQIHDGRRIAVGPGTFTFGNSPTGSFVKKSN